MCAKDVSQKLQKQKILVKMSVNTCLNNKIRNMNVPKFFFGMIHKKQLQFFRIKTGVGREF